MRVLLAAVVLLLAGCSGAPAGPSDPTASGANAGSNSGGPPTVAGLNWSVGQTWTHDITIDTGGTLIEFSNQVVVTEQTDIGWKLASTDLETAVNNAAFFFQDMGEMLRKGELSDGVLSFPYYDFPLTDNKTWSATESNVGTDLEPIERQLSFTARWMPAAGAVPGHYMVEAREGDRLRARYDYRPDLQWFSFYDGFGDGGGNYTMKTSASGKNWKGEHHYATSELLTSTIIGNQLDPGQPTEPPIFLPGGAYSSNVEVAAAATHVLLLQFAYGAPGAGQTQILAPDGTRYSTYGAYGADPTPVAADGAQTQVIAPAQPGAWQVEASGAGVFANGYGIFFWQMTVETATL